MNRIIEKIFRHRTVVFERLADYGFVTQDKKHIYTKNICDDQMQIVVTVDEHGGIDAKVYDMQDNDVYMLFLAEDAAGSFVGSVREDYEKVLTDICEKCFIKDVFKSSQAKLVIKYVREVYGTELEYLWNKFPDNAIWRRSDNQKWFGVLLTVSKRKLGFDQDGMIEVIDLRTDPEKIDGLVDNVKYLRGYHMNKKHWISICLDGSVDLEEIFGRIDLSYKLALK